MQYESVDALQRTLAANVFQYARDQKKAAGRALGTLVEIVTFYTLRTWNLRDHVVIERSVSEFANPHISHNVEFSLHPIKGRLRLEVPLSLPLTPAKIKNYLPFVNTADFKSTQILSSDRIKRNSAVLVENQSGPITAHVDALQDTRCLLTVCDLARNPFAIFECKRVGVEEGMKKGPQTIEKAKQGAYVARSVSSLQKIRLRSGEFRGVIERRDGTLRSGLYGEVLRELIEEDSVVDLEGFILTVGVVSNHGNWFTSENHNKELRVLAQSYDWLLFLTDAGLSQFINMLLLNPTSELAPARHAFLASYSGTSGSNRFTKVRIDIDADEALQMFFARHKADIRSWFNVISPGQGSVDTLQQHLHRLAEKDW